MPDEEAWDRCYEGTGDFPEDSLGTVLNGLKRASENPEIENVIFDLSCNGGGSPDVMTAAPGAGAVSPSRRKDCLLRRECREGRQRGESMIGISCQRSPRKP